MCKYCERKPVSTEYGWRPWENEEILESGCYTQLNIGVDGDSRIYLAAYGDDDAIWYPNFCPVCGRPLRGHHQYTTTLENALSLDKLCEWLAENAWHIDCSDCDGEHCDCPQLHDDGNSPAFWKEKLTKWIEGLK